MKPILQIKNISKKYQIHHIAGGYQSLRERVYGAFSLKREQLEDFWALKDVSFDVHEGESIGIIGKNGAGKSTLLKILSKITRPTAGSIHIKGRIASLLEVGTGFHPELTGRENIYFNGSLLGMKRREINANFDAIVDFSDTEKFLDTPLKHYSSGMQLRLAFSVAAFLEPEILVIDEVLAVGDADFQKKCMGKMEEVSSQGRTILFVSHNMAAIRNLCSRGVLLKEGQVLHSGDIRDVVERYLKTDSVRSGNDDLGILLKNEVFVKGLSFGGDQITSLQDITFGMTIESATSNRINDLAILIFNQLNERVGIIDLRSNDLWTRSAESKRLIINGEVKNIPLIEGVYHVGLYISSAHCQGDYLNLKRLEVLPVESSVVPYSVKNRGYLELDAGFKIQ